MYVPKHTHTGTRLGFFRTQSEDPVIPFLYQHTQRFESNVANPWYYYDPSWGFLTDLEDHERGKIRFTFHLT